MSFREGFSIVSSSSDGTMHIKYLTPNKQDKKIDIGSLDISCFSRLEYRSDPEKVEFLIGLGKGDIILYQETTNMLFQTQQSKKTLEAMKSQEGSIIELAYSRSILVWATAKQVRIRYYRDFASQG